MTFILVGEQQIAAFALMQVRAKLKLEVENPAGPKWRDSPAHSARAILVEAGRPDPGRTKKKIYAAYCAYLSEQGL